MPGAACLLVTVLLQESADAVGPSASAPTPLKPGVSGTSGQACTGMRLGASVGSKANGIVTFAFGPYS